MRTDTRLGLALLVALVAQLWPWSQLTRDGATLRLAAASIAVVLAVGWAGRRLKLPTPALTLVQLAAAVAGTLGSLVWAHGAQHLGRLPTVLTDGLRFFRDSAAPLFPQAGATLLIVGLVTLLAMLADWLAITWARPAWAVPPLVVLHLVPALGLATPTLFGEFVLLAAGIVLVLLAGSPLSRTERPATKAAALLTAGAVGAAGIGLTWALSLMVPTFETRRSNEPLQMNDPSLDLKRNLVQGSDEVVIRYTSDGGDGLYLKLATLPALGNGGFALSDVRVATGRLPAPPGNPAGTPRTTRVDVGAFRSEWLPVPYAPTSFEAPGRWGFALDTLDVMALSGPERGSATELISYEVTSLDVRPAPEVVARATANAGDRALTTEVPPEVTDRVRALAREVTADAPTAGAKAQALEVFLRSDRFSYSTAPTAGVGDGLATIDDFLFRSREGYCEQFAGAMAIMAREVGIPSRMAVGFAPGTQTDSGWEVTARDLHTWPELWLDGLGWVAFEPTPSRSPSTGAPTDGGGTTAPSAAPTETSTPTPAPAESSPPAPTDEAGTPEGMTVASVLPWVLAALALAGAVVGTALAPRWLRRRRRARRLAGTGDARVDTLAAWDEVRDTAADLRIPWPDGSPRFAAERFAPRLGGDEDAADALRRLAAASERALFDRSEAFDAQGTWRDEVLAIIGALAAAGGEQKDRPIRAVR